MAKKSKGQYQPPGEAIDVGVLRARFLSSMAEILPRCIDDLFQRAFNALSVPSSRQMEGIKIWPVCHSLKVEEQYLAPYNYWHVLLSKVAIDWAEENRIYCDWVFDFCHSVLSHYWTRCVVAESNGEPPLLAFIFLYLRGSHFKAWKGQALQLEIHAENDRDFSHLYTLEEQAMLTNGGEVSLSIPDPPLFFPDPIRWGKVLTKEEYENEILEEITREVFHWQQRNVPFEICGRIAEEIFKARRWQYDMYWGEFAAFLRSRGWGPRNSFWALDDHLKWLILHRCGKLEFAEVQKHCNAQGEYFEVHRIRDGITSKEEMLGFKSVRERGGSRPGTRKRDKADPKNRTTQIKEE
jgi:hypothetical protein